MLTSKQLEEYKKQHEIDKEQFRKDQLELREAEKYEDRRARSFFQRMRAKYLNFHLDQHEKLNRLLAYTDITSDLDKYPKIQSAYMTYHGGSLLLMGFFLIAPKKILSKLLSCLVFYGIKLNITDGLFTYYLMQNMALGGKMTSKEQELRNVMEFYYIRNKFRNKPMTDEEQKQADTILEKIKIENDKYENYKRLSNLL